MRKGTTPIIEFLYQDEKGVAVDLSNHTVFFTLKDRNNKIKTFTNDRMTFNEDYSIDILLTQEETLELDCGRLLAQVRAIDSEGTAIASDFAATNLEDILLPGVIEYESNS